MSILHNDFMGDETYYHSNGRVQEIMAKATGRSVNQHGQPYCYLKGRNGLSNWLLLVRSVRAQVLLAAYDGRRVIYRGDQQDEEHEGGKKGAEPTQRSVELEFFGGQSDGVTAMRLGEAGS
ncbi:hypothetical protein DL766_006369 [Monosporascus sp. MC13-8B]|uniref:Uncharacterized protein n=1 Tax=Monosporascus cannonballus TaxID=155416 RepID=A0ABY0GXS6_9PEZI|nr:hypothetical protein DL762_007986 [Monosporascus cannonballus]RYO84782.1 hypothetical protein DL763_007347 [Monosporascus cannonballus]RYP27459.1 hypothetical protein DL766_006369 [Monosporascus sp. MC13-8B]